MGRALPTGNNMPTVDEAFAKFKNKISVPTEKESKDASRRQKEIRGVMDREFHVERDFLSGSYARWTKTKPLKDVDIFCVLGGEDHKYRDEDPSVILDKVAKIMSDEYGKENVAIQTRSVGIAFKNAAEEEVMSFDVVTAFDADKHYDVPDTKSKAKWTKTDPEIHKDLARDKHAAYSSEWKGLVRMVKTWNRHHDRPVKPSFLLEVMALQLFDGKFGGDYRYEMKGFFSSAAEHIFDSWPDPAGLGPDVSARMDTTEKTNAQRALREAADQCLKAIQLERGGKVGEALRVWQGIFGNQFSLS
jgi:Second Messenger Oligonucleotide or Dinucleotide Synthetase domain